MQVSKKNRRVTIAVAVLILLLLGSTIGIFSLAASIYDSNFDYRCTTGPGDTFRLSQFPSLTRQRHTFTSNNGQQLVGYLYEQADPAVQTKGVIVFAHGLGGGGQTGYMDIFAFMTAQGYLVFAYDATGNDESEGEVIGGLPQGIIDLDHALDYVSGLDELRGYPVMLMGYSWGAYSVTNVLNYHPEVRAVAALAGFNRSMDLIMHRGQQIAGDAAGLLQPCAVLHEYFMYGNYAFSSALKGFANSECKVMIIHGEQDETVPFEYGYGAFYEKYGSDARFTFRKYSDRDHDVLSNDLGFCDTELLAEISLFFDNSLQ